MFNIEAKCALCGEVKKCKIAIIKGKQDFICKDCYGEAKFFEEAMDFGFELGYAGVESTFAKKTQNLDMSTLKIATNLLHYNGYQRVDLEKSYLDFWGQSNYLDWFKDLREYLLTNNKGVKMGNKCDICRKHKNETRKIVKCSLGDICSNCLMLLKMIGEDRLPEHRKYDILKSLIKYKLNSGVNLDRIRDELLEYVDVMSDKPIKDVNLKTLMDKVFDRVKDNFLKVDKPIKEDELFDFISKQVYELMNTYLDNERWLKGSDTGLAHHMLCNLILDKINYIPQEGVK